MAGFLTFVLGVIYAIFILWINKRYSIKYIPVNLYTGEKKRPYRLANVLRIISGMSCALIFLGSFIPLFIYYGYPAIRHLLDPSFLIDEMQSIYPMNFDINTAFRLDLAMQSAFKITGIKDQVFWGKVTMNIIPQKMLFWHAYQIMYSANTLISLYVNFQLCNIFTAICNGDAFTSLITRGLKKLGIVIILWNIAAPVIKYYGQGVLLKNITVNTEALKLSRYFYFDDVLNGVFIGIALLVLAGIINEAIKIHEEQRLTI